MASDMRIPLEVRGLSKNYPSFRLDRVSFTLAPGTITGFIGRNGAGKSTTINSIMSFVRPDEGKVTCFGAELDESSREIREKIGFVSAGMTFYTRKKLKTISGVVRSFYPRWDEKAYLSRMAAFGLDEGKTPAQLSNGMKIKFALALALSRGAELMILDEPTSGLDPVSREELVEIFLKLKDEGKTVFFSTHITSDLEKCADHILFLQRGRLMADDTLDGFRDSWRIAECAGELSPALKEASRGICRTRDGYTVLIPGDGASVCDSRPASLEEIMVHLEKGAEEK